VVSSFIRNWLTALLDPRRAVGTLGLPRYFADWCRYRKLSGPGVLRVRESYPCLTDWRRRTPFDRHYVYQGMWAASKLAAAECKIHVDIGSSVLWVSAVASIAPTVFLDYRPVRIISDRMLSVGGDILSLPFRDGTIRSLSCLHVMEHIGLGRYGEPLDPRGSRKAAGELMRVLAPEGRLLLSVPIGRERVQFNAHRVFSVETVLSIFQQLELRDLAIVDDAGYFLSAVEPRSAPTCEYGCGLFEFVRKGSTR
jgi:hypothetical protein